MWKNTVKSQMRNNDLMDVLRLSLRMAPNSKMCIRDRDNGIGMSEEFQKHIFEQFARERQIGRASCRERV